MRNKELCDIVSALEEVRTLCVSPGSVIKMESLTTCNSSSNDFQSIKLNRLH